MTRRTLSMVAGQAQTTNMRGTIREQEDHLLPEATHIDGFHSQTHSNKGAPLELYQPIGLAYVLIKQQDDQSGQKQQTKKSSDQTGNDQWNHDQPKGPAAEAFVAHLGSFSHPFAFPFDRRVHPYDFKKGENPTYLYAADGSEQGVYIDSRFTRVMSLDNKSVADSENSKTRFASVAHVEKKMQTHKKKKGQQSEDYKHEGETVNTEVRVTKTRIEFRVGDEVVGYYDKASQQWAFKGMVLLGDDDMSKMKQVHRKSDIDSEGDQATLGSSKVWAVS